jgi:hypothetical protein
MKVILCRQNSEAIPHQVPPASPLEISAGKYQRDFLDETE